MKRRYKVAVVAAAAIIAATVLTMLWWWTLHPDTYPADVMVSVIMTELILVMLGLVFTAAVDGGSNGN